MTHPAGEAPACVEVAVFSPLSGSFTYRWSPQFGLPAVGMRVQVLFGRGKRLGIVTAVDTTPPADYELKAVCDLLDPSPLFDASRLAWLSRAARYYLAGLGTMLETAAAWADDSTRSFRCLEREKLADFDAGLARVFTSRRAMNLKTVIGKLNEEGAQFRMLQALGAGLLHEKESEPAPYVDNMPGEAVPDTLTAAQQEALERILQQRQKFSPYLLFGCTGSGKTEVYIRAAQQLIGEGRQVLILVPEIGLTPMWLSRLSQRLSNIGVWHSGLSDAERRAVRNRLNKLDVLIGTRSALFLPLPRLGLIVLDEEHDSSFKQQEGVRYHARDMALLLAQELKIPVVLGSATPSLESWRQAKSGKYVLLRLPERIALQQCIEKCVVDMRGHHDVISPPLLDALQKARQAGQQSLLYLNRRGYAPALHCTACGHVPECPACSLRLTLHRSRRQLRCHACGFLKAAPKVCADCGEDALLPLGSGTEKVEELLKSLLPDVSFQRFDRDAITHPRQLQQLLEAFARGEIDCLVGTQMLVKGHHFPNVTLVGVVHADQGLSLPDFRAGERWWQQMTQVVGRTGRGDAPGRVLIQTYSPDAPWLARIGDESAEAVLNDELHLREQLDYPPYARWARIVFSAVDARRAEGAAMQLAEALRNHADVKVAGPMPAAVERLAGRYRFELVLRDSSREWLPWKLAPFLDAMPVPSGVRRVVDVDPVDMM